MWIPYFKQYLSSQFINFLTDKPWNYKNDLCIIGARDLFFATKDESFNTEIINKAKWLIDENDNVINWAKGESNIDKVSFGKSFKILQDLTGQEKYKNAVDKAYNMFNTYPRTVTGNFWHKDIYPNQVWLDGLYMGMPFYAQYLADNNLDKWDDVFDQFKTAHELLWNEEISLYMHACDCSKEAEWANKENGQSPAVWLRAEGWFLMALVDTFEIVNGKTERASELTALLKNAVDGILKYQVEETKMFLQVTDLTDLEGNYSETSGSAMVAYSLMKGARLGMLSASYGEKGSEIIDGIKSTYLKQEGNKIHLYGICASAGLGAGPDNRTDRTGTPQYYLSEKQMTDNQHGAAACMMAVSEQLRR